LRASTNSSEPSRGHHRQQREAGPVVAERVGHRAGHQRAADLPQRDDGRRQAHDHADGMAAEVVGADGLHERPAQAPGHAVQGGEHDQHEGPAGVGQHQQADGVHQHAPGGHVALLEAVADEVAQAHAGGLPDGHQRDEERGVRHRVAQPFLQMRDRMHVDGGDDQQRHAVAQRQQPERARAQGLART
jgi:hypothetical protein